MSFLIGAGSVVSTAEDLFRFVRALRAGDLGERSWATLVSASSPTTWLGASNGFFSWITIDPAADRVVIFTGNSFGYANTRLQGALPALLAGQSAVAPPLPTTAARVAPETRSSYVGTYELRPGSRLSVTLRRGELMFANSVLLPISDTVFLYQPWFERLTFEGSGDQLLMRRANGRAIRRVDTRPGL